jgi:PKHD-type hydroxylase
MLIVIEGVLDKAQVARFADDLTRARWVDGAVTAGTRSVRVKQNAQVDEDDRVGIALGEEILHGLGRNALFLSAALPEKIYPPKFNLYENGGHYGTHVDAAIMRCARLGMTVRSDVSATIFLSEPDDYDGGELVIEGEFGAQEVKLGAGDMVLYPSSSLHRVEPVTRGRRLASFLWLQSAVADAGARALLFDMDQGIQALDADRLGQVYHNLLRRWAQV